MKLTAFVPVKAYSERLSDKNFKVLGGKPLYRHTLDKLEDIDLIDQVVINTDSQTIIEDCSERYSKVKILIRPDHLLDNKITMNAIIEYDLSKTAGDHFLQTHVTNPLLSKRTIIDSINKYFENLEVFDSLLSVFPVKKRVYDYKGLPINHKLSLMEQTQDLSPILVENSNLFIFSRTSFFKNNLSRVGCNPQLFFMNEFEGIDIDYQDDFTMAELLYNNRHLFNYLD